MAYDKVLEDEITDIEYEELLELDKYRRSPMPKYTFRINACYP